LLKKFHLFQEFQRISIISIIQNDGFLGIHFFLQINKNRYKKKQKKTQHKNKNKHNK